VNFWGVGSVGNVESVGKSMIFQHSQCFQCFQCSKKRGTPLKNPPLLRTQFAPNTAQGAHKFHKGETARQGRQHSAGGAHKLHKGETARQGRQHSTGGAHKLHKGETARQGRQHSAGERTSSTRVKQHGRGDSSGKQERGRQALRSCDFGGHCFGSL
jgi:hypothetical protein